MTDAVISVAAKAAEYLVKPTIQQGQYMFCANMIIQNLVEEKEQLSEKIKDIQEHIQEEKKKTKLTEKSEKWVKEAENLLEAAENLKQEMEAKTNCFQEWCPPWRRYRMFKQMAKKTEEMRMQSKIEIEPSSRLISLSNIDYDCSESFTFFQSTSVAYKQILEALQDGETKIIGLYGMGGSGKTALVNKVRKEAMKSQLFDKFILVTMSQTPHIQAIQEEMAKMLNLELREENEEERAKRLWLSLKEHNRILIIVDDAWEKLNLKHIGIDFDKNHEGNCKVLLTTRSQEVCALMKCQKIKLDLLSEEEAWSLFTECAGIDDQLSPMILNLAQEVSKRCKGLPIAIKVMGSSLKGKQKEFQIDRLKVALKRLKGSKPKKEGDEGDVFNCLRFSYDYLKIEESRHLLSMCAMFPEDHEIPIEDLIRYGVRLGVCAEYESFDFARSQIRMGLSELLDSCLLMYADEEKMLVKMHDLVHEMALSISQEMDQTILVNHEKDLNSLARDKLKQCFALSLWDNKTHRLPFQLEAPKLEILIVTTWSSLDLSSMSFEFIKRLKVMAIINNDPFSVTPISLPQSIQSMINLKTLRLQGWQLGDFSFVFGLEGLEVLDLQRCIFNEVPDEIEKLHNLKLLDLRYTTVKNYNSKAIGRCSKLEEFYAYAFWHFDSLYNCPPSPMCFVHDVTPESLLRYELKLGGMLHEMGIEKMKNLEEMGSIMRVLYLQKFDVSTIDGSKKNLLQKAEYVCFNDLRGGSKNIVPDIDQAVGCMNELNRLYLVFCSEIECLFDATFDHTGSFQGDALLPWRLTMLRLVMMENMTEMCHGEPPLDFFMKLKELHISSCYELHNVFPRQCNLNNLKILNVHGCAIINFFSMSVAKSMQQLEEMTIGGCPELRHVITSDAEDGANTREEISLAPNKTHLLFPSLKKLRISNCPKLQVIFPISCAQQNEIQIILPRLQVFELDDLENLLGIFPQNYTSRWPSVRTLSWRNCPKLTTSWIGLELKQQEVVRDEVHQEHVTSKLQELTLIDLPKLSLLWFGPTATRILSFQYLQCLKINGFKEMKIIFSMAVLRSLLGLTSLYIGNCDELVEIIVENEESKNYGPVEVFFPKLSKLEIEQCNKLKSLFSIAMIKTLPQLNTLRVKEAAQLKEIFGQSSEGDIVNEMETVVPNLREIELEKLPSFVNIYQGFMMHKARLKHVEVNECPKFTPVLGATQAIPLHHRTEEKLIVWSIALSMNQLSVALKAFLSIESFELRNSGAEGILQLQLVEEGQGGLQKHFNSNLRSLDLHELTELRFIWSGPTQFLGFHKLIWISVDGCPKLKTVFPASIVGSLQNLETLTVRNCEELEEIFESCPTQFLGFHELRWITVDGCPKLKTVFPASIVGSLQNLNTLTVRNCEELEEIFESQVECFPNLDWVIVEKCNKLKCIFYADSMASRHYAPPAVLRVRKCSQLERIYSLKRATEVDSKDHGEQEKLLDLYEFELKSLPNFTEIGLGIKLKEKPCDFYEVEECPKYSQQFADGNEEEEEDDDDIAKNSDDDDDQSS